MRGQSYFAFIIFIFTFLTQTSFSSNDELISKLNKRSESYRTIDSKKAIELSLKATELADKGNNNSLKALSYKNLGVALYYHNAYQEALTSYQKALNLYIPLNDSVGLSACYNNMAAVYKDLNNFREASNYYLKALAIDNRLNDKQGLAIVYNNLGEVFHLQAKYIWALQFYMNSLKYETELNNLNGIADCYLNLGAVMEENNFFDKALFYYKKALFPYKQTSDYFRLGQCYNNMGIAYTRINDFYNAKDCLTKSIAIKERTHDNQGKVTSLLNLGNLYILLNDTVKAKECFINAVFSGDNEAFTKMQNIKNNNASYFQNVDDYFFYWISYRIQEGNYLEIPQSLFYKGYIHFNLGEYSKAISYFINSLETAENQPFATIRKDDYLYISKSYQHLNDFKNANFYAQQYINLTDSINSSLILDFMNFKSTSSFDVNMKEKPHVNEEISKSLFENGWFISTTCLSIFILIMFAMFIRKK